MDIDNGSDKGSNDGALLTEGLDDGTLYGISDGTNDSCIEGFDGVESDGILNGKVDGSLLNGGMDDGSLLVDGFADGTFDGISDGTDDGCIEGSNNGTSDGVLDGKVDDSLLTRALMMVTILLVIFGCWLVVLLCANTFDSSEHVK